MAIQRNDSTSLDPAIRLHLASLYTGDNVFTTSEEEDVELIARGKDTDIGPGRKEKRSSSVLFKPRTDKLLKETDSNFRIKRPQIMTSPKKDRQTKAEQMTQDRQDEHAATPAEIKKDKNPYPYKPEVTDQARANNNNNGQTEVKKGSRKAPFSGGGFFNMFNRNDHDKTRSRDPAQELHLPRPYLWRPSPDSQEFGRMNKMSYMYSGGYGNSGYEYDRNGYHDRHYKDRDSREMYPTKKELVQTYPTRVEHERPRWGWCMTIMSVIVTVICCPLFGFVGYSFAQHAYVDHKAGDWYTIRHKKRCSWGWTVTGLILGILGWIALITCMALIWAGVWAGVVPVVSG